MALACVVLPTELVSRELDAAESAVSRLEHLDHLVFEVQDEMRTQLFLSISSTSIGTWG